MWGTFAGGRLTVRPDCWGYMRIPPEHNWILKGKPTWVIHSQFKTGYSWRCGCCHFLLPRVPMGHQSAQNHWVFVVSMIFWLVSPKMGKSSFFFTIFSNGLKPPSNFVLVVGGTSSEASFHQSWRTGLIQRSLLFLYMSRCSKLSIVIPVYLVNQVYYTEKFRYLGLWKRIPTPKIDLYLNMLVIRILIYNWAESSAGCYAMVLATVLIQPCFSLILLKKRHPCIA